jgi:hypothetical protein
MLALAHQLTPAAPCVPLLRVAVVDAKHILLHLDDVKPDGIVNESIQQVCVGEGAAYLCACACPVKKGRI